MKDSSHWYDPVTGEARHTIVGANGKERATTLRDARKEGWLPSVTTVFKVLAKPELDRWKQIQVLMASLTLPKIEGETEEVYCARIIEDAFKQVGDAADLGTSIHLAIENHFQGKPYDKSLSVYVDAVDKWVAENQVSFLHHEKRILGEGYAGTTDAIIKQSGFYGEGVLDFKSRKSKEGKPMTPYSTEPMQISAYAHAENCTFGCNLYISTTEPGRVEAVFYELERLWSEFEAFKHVLALWQHSTGYNPALVKRD